MFTKTIRLISDGEKGGRGYEGGGRGKVIYLSLHCHHQNDMKMGSDENYFNVSLIVRDKVTRQCPRTTTFEERGEPKQNSWYILTGSFLMLSWMLRMYKVEYFVFTHMPGESYRRWLRSLFYLYYIFQMLINSLVCWILSWPKRIGVDQWNNNSSTVGWPP